MRSCRLLPALLLLLTSGLVSDVEAQHARRVRKKPFAELSASAERLKASVASRLGVSAVPVGKVALVAMDSTSAIDSLVAAARSQLGTRYILGAERPGQAFDCSGLVRFVLAALRLDLPRTANEQAQRGVEVAREVSRLRPGDLLTFAKKGDRVTHIGVYIGDGQFVHASTSNRRVVEASIEQPGTWFRRNWVGVRRVLAFAETADTAATY